MAIGNEIADALSSELKMIGDGLMDTSGSVDAFALGLLQEYRDKAVDNQVEVSELVNQNAASLVETEKALQEAVAQTAEIEKERNAVIEDAIEIEGKQMEAQKLSVENLKQIGQATLDAYNSISGSILEIKRNEANEIMAIIDKELEHTLGALNKEKEERLIAAGFAVENNEQSLEAQLEAARSSGDEALAYQLERRLQEKEINDEYDRLAEEANRAAAEEKAKLEYEVAKQEHAMNIVNAIQAAALAILSSWKTGLPLGAVLAGLTAAATAVQIAAIQSNAPKMPTFSTGGIVPGASFSGDMIPAMLNSREMVMNMEQQENLFNAIKSNALSSNKAVIRVTVINQLNGREISQVVADTFNDGIITLNSRAVR